MTNPLQALAALAVLHLDEAPESRRADLLEAAGSIFSMTGGEREAEQLKTAAAIRREADRAQLALIETFKPTA